MTKYFYYFEIEYWDEINEKISTDKGFTRASTYTEVAADIASWYGEDNIENMHINIMENGDGPLTVSMIIDALGPDLHKHEDYDAD